ncbi:PREDICTED: thioredoxin-like protein AAED1, chloroplastic [Fragaria vesca subsp. vesca]|uniref:thioredoxin-like protein AAED1, chloroplastic n=1 Tax=Fragaria vesca subsp. vesca TaxID=101020 RepID=UPI0002C347D6|nr:PREDICTED: thioredoxin-like protein AAED1, chloroplastic [Fragaria vesca subsp. vesca]
MAVALSSATLFPSRLGVQRTSTDQNSTRVTSSPSPNAIVFNLNRCSRGVSFSRRRSGVVASAASGSPGIESSSSNAEDTASLLDTVKVFDLNGNGIPISDLWKDRTAVIAFARHFGCVFCRKRADYLASKKDIMDKSGVALVLIGPGSINQAKSFSEQTRFKGEVYADPSHSSYEALRFVSGVTTTFTPKAGLKIIQLYMEGYRQDWKLSFEQDTVSRGGWQQGGIIVAGPGKSNILYIHKDKEAGDDPDINDILNACCGA